MIFSNNKGADTHGSKASSWIFFLIIVVAALLRFATLGQWSLWEDEETTIYFSQHLDNPFPKTFPVFFILLNSLFRFTGISVEAGRMISAAAGIVSILLLYICFKRFIPRQAALLASFFMTINIGHLFWSQSIRYYMLVFCFQLLSMFWFVKGFESGQKRLFLLSGVFFALALFSHSSAVLLLPVYLLFIIIVALRGETGGNYLPGGYLLAGFILMAVAGIFIAKFAYQLQLQGALDQGMPIPSSRDPVKFFMRVIAYFGAPVVFLSILAPFLVHEVPERIVLFFVIAAFLPIGELAVVTVLNSYFHIGSVTWYYAFFSLIGMSVLSALVLVSVYRRGRPFLSMSVGVLSLIYYCVFLGYYHTSMHGGRPVWREATEYLQQAANVEVQSSENPEIYATAPGVVAYYLGVDAGQTMGSSLVKRAEFHPPADIASSDWWLLLKSNYMNEQYQDWLAAHGIFVGRFDSKIWGFDQWTILVYHNK